jgi:hypothetical protein
LILLVMVLLLFGELSCKYCGPGGCVYGLYVSP